MRQTLVGPTNAMCRTIAFHLSRIVLPALLCCFLSCSSDEALVRQASDTPQPSGPTAEFDSTAAANVAPPTGACPGLATLDHSMLSLDAPDSARQIFLVSPKRFGDTEVSLTRCLGVPLEVVVDTVSNLHTGEPDHILHITYPGIRYSIYRVLADGKEILFRVEAFAPTEELALGIGVGVPWSHVLQQLGAPTDEDRRAEDVFVARYVVDQFVEETVTVWVEDGIVSRISWDYYID